MTNTVLHSKEETYVRRGGTLTLNRKRGHSKKSSMETPRWKNSASRLNTSLEEVAQLAISKETLCL